MKITADTAIDFVCPPFFFVRTDFLILFSEMSLR